MNETTYFFTKNEGWKINEAFKMNRLIFKIMFFC